MKGKIEFQFNGAIWQYSTLKGSWYFVSLPVEISNEIRENWKWQEEGWGRLKATARINHTEWETAIWFDSKMKTYLLPLKADVRRKEKLEFGNFTSISIWI